MVFQVTPNSKIKCMKRNCKTIISLVNPYGDNITKDKLLQFLLISNNKKLKTSVITMKTPFLATKVPMKKLIFNQFINNLFLKLITLHSNSLIRASIKLTKTIIKTLPKFKRLKMNHK